MPIAPTLPTRLTGALLLALTAGCRGAAPGGEPDLELYATAPIETALQSDDLTTADAVWIAAIDAATQHIELAHFYASPAPQELGPDRLEPVVAALEAAAARGVHVRFIGDERFYGEYPQILDRLERCNGIEVRRIDLSERTGGVHHAKYLTVDDALVAVGSHNFDWRSLAHIQELGVQVRSEAIAAAFRDVFELDWRLAADSAAALEPASMTRTWPIALNAGELGYVAVTPVFSPRDLLPDPALFDLPYLLERIDSAHSELCIALLTYRPVSYSGERFEELQRAIESAAARGVRVRLLVADWGKRSGTVEELQRIQQLDNLEVRFVTLPEASLGFIPFARCIHAKYLVADAQRAWIGTSNFERGYFEESRNAGLLLDGSGVGRRLTQLFEHTWNSAYAYPVDPHAEYEPPRVAE